METFKSVFKQKALKVKLFFIATFIVILGGLQAVKDLGEEDSPREEDSSSDVPILERYTIDPDAPIEEITVTAKRLPEDGSLIRSDLDDQQ